MADSSRAAAGERRDRLEGGQREQRQHRDQHAVELPVGRRLDREREDAGDGDAGHDQPEGVAVPAASASRRASRTSARVGVADASQRGRFAAEGGELGRGAEELHELGRQLAARAGLAAARAAPRGSRTSAGTATPAISRPAARTSARGGQERGGDADATAPPARSATSGRQQAAQVEVLLRVDVGDHAREQVALAVAVRARPARAARCARRRASRTRAERAQRDVVRREPLEVAHDRAAEAERLDRGDGDHQRQDRRAARRRVRSGSRHAP